MKNIISHIIRIVIVSIFLVSTTTMWYYKYQNEEHIKSIMLNKDVLFVEKSSPINITNAYPLNDDEITNLKGYQFELKKKQNNETNVTIVLEKSKIEDESKRLSNSFLKYQVKKNGKILISPTKLGEDGVLFIDTISEDTTYEVKLWLSSDCTTLALNKIFKSKIALL